MDRCELILNTLHLSNDHRVCMNLVCILCMNASCAFIYINMGVCKMKSMMFWYIRVYLSAPLLSLFLCVLTQASKLTSPS